jgi:hypothetical protein
MHNTFSKAPADKAPADKTPGTPAPDTPSGAPTGEPGNGTPGGRTRPPGTRPAGMRTLSTGTLWAAAAISLVALTGCDQIDPLQRPYMWHPTGVNEQNIAAMAANPADLVHGRDSPQRRVIVESDGVARLWTGHQLPLLSDTPGASTSSGSSTGGGAPAGGGGS